MNIELTVNEVEALVDFIYNGTCSDMLYEIRRLAHRVERLRPTRFKAGDIVHRTDPDSEWTAKMAVIAATDNNGEQWCWCRNADGNLSTHRARLLTHGTRP